MKIVIGDKDQITINAGISEATCYDVFCGIGIQTDRGRFVVAQRDGVIEILFNGKLIINSDEVKTAITGRGGEGYTTVSR